MEQAGVNLNVFGALKGAFSSKSTKETAEDGSSVENKQQHAGVQGESGCRRSGPSLVDRSCRRRRGEHKCQRCCGRGAAGQGNASADPAATVVATNLNRHDRSYVPSAVCVQFIQCSPGSPVSLLSQLLHRRSVSPAMCLLQLVPLRLIFSSLS